MSLSFEIREETNLDELLPVRWRNLYPDRAMDPEDNRETDLADGTIHFVAASDGGIVGCVTLTEEFAQDRSLRMRWIGVDEPLRGQGIGAALARACLREAARRELGIWCNARITALALYRRIGFEQVGSPFDIPGIGAHIVMRTP